MDYTFEKNIAMLIITENIVKCLNTQWDIVFGKGDS